MVIHRFQSLGSHEEDTLGRLGQETRQEMLVRREGRHLEEGLPGFHGLAGKMGQGQGHSVAPPRQGPTPVSPPISHLVLDHILFEGLPALA